MTTLKVLVGDIESGDWDFENKSGNYLSKRCTFEGSFFGKLVKINLNEDLDFVTRNISSDLKNKFSSAAGAGAIGSLFGPVGAAIGAVLGSMNTQITFEATLKNGKRFIAVTQDSKTWETFSTISEFNEKKKQRNSQPSEPTKRSDQEMLDDWLKK